MAGEYTTLAVLKSALNIQTSETSADDLLNAALAAASRGIDAACGRRFYLDAAASARTYNPAGRVVCDGAAERLLIDDIGDVTGLTVETGSSGNWTAITDYETAPDNAIARGRPVTALVRTYASWGYGAEDRVRVTAKWGWPAVPDNIVQAAIIQALRLYNRKGSPEGVTGSAEWGVVRLSRRDPDVWALIEPYMLPGFG